MVIHNHLSELQAGCCLFMRLSIAVPRRHAGREHVLASTRSSDCDSSIHVSHDVQSCESGQPSETRPPLPTPTFSGHLRPPTATRKRRVSFHDHTENRRETQAAIIIVYCIALYQWQLSNGCVQCFGATSFVPLNGTTDGQQASILLISWKLESSLYSATTRMPQSPFNRNVRLGHNKT